MTDPILDPLRAKMRRELVKYLVSKAIFCPMEGSVLDYRTCVVLNDADGDPAIVLSQDAWKTILRVIEEKDLTMAQAFPSGHTVDESTVKA